MGSKLKPQVGPRLGRHLGGVLGISWEVLGGQDAPKTFQDGAKTRQDGAKTAQDGAKTGQGGAETPQDGAKTLQAGAKTGQEPQDTKTCKKLRNEKVFLGSFGMVWGGFWKSNLFGRASARASEASEARGAQACSAKQTEEMR